MKFNMNAIWEYANPLKFMRTTERVLPWFTWGAVLCLAVGLIWAFFFTSNESRQGATIKIFFIHVPTATMAVNIWFMMLLTSLVWIIRRHHVSALAARAAAPVGAVMLLVALITGALWGQPIWNTAWEWDPRLTSFLILFLFYLGYMALWAAIEDDETAADLTSILCLVGSVFAVLSRYAVKFWNQGLHQDSTVLKVGQEDPLHVTYYIPLIFCFFGFFFLFVALVIVRTNTEIRARRLRALEARERMT